MYSLIVAMLLAQPNGQFLVASASPVFFYQDAETCRMDADLFSARAFFEEYQRRRAHAFEMTMQNPAHASAIYLDHLCVAKQSEAEARKSLEYEWRSRVAGVQPH